MINNRFNVVYHLLGLVKLLFYKLENIMDIMDRMKEFNSSYDNFSMVWKSYQVLREGLKVSNEEIDELIEYHKSKEDYEICEKLNKLKTII